MTSQEIEQRIAQLDQEIKALREQGLTALRMERLEETGLRLGDVIRVTEAMHRHARLNWGVHEGRRFQELCPVGTEIAIQDICNAMDPYSEIAIWVGAPRTPDLKGIHADPFPVTLIQAARLLYLREQTP